MAKCKALMGSAVRGLRLVRHYNFGKNRSNSLAVHRKQSIALLNTTELFLCNSSVCPSNIYAHELVLEK